MNRQKFGGNGGGHVVSRVRLYSIAIALSLAGPAWAAIDAAEVVVLIGSGERRDAAASEWAPIAVKQQVKGGAFVRTLANSQIGLLMPDRTQIRLNQNSQLQIKSGAEATQWTETAVKLNAGRAWSQARPQTAQDTDKSKAVRVVMETPSATLSIRGTDWEVEVGPDGQTQLVVLSGLVGMGNEFGAIEVAPGEAAVAVPGKAPVKLKLIDPGSRVQWVSSWKPQPERWLGGKGLQELAPIVAEVKRGQFDEAMAQLRATGTRSMDGALLLADLLLYKGEYRAAVETLSPYCSEKAEPRAMALTVRALLRMDQRAQAASVLDAAERGQFSHVELFLARGEWAVLDGNAEQARSAYSNAAKLDQANAEAWYGLGLIASERENVVQAREFLAKALLQNPRFGKASAELGAAESFAGNLPASTVALDAALRMDPADYQALTVRGINALKRGLASEALEDFMRAGVIEPRYARAWLYSGVAFYQLGEMSRARQAFTKASSLDPRDPVPHLLTGMASTDALDFGDAIQSAQQASASMPYLKSLNQIANNQRGSANLGSALANFGLEEWARLLADAAYSPFLAGSHLFIADRYEGKFLKNSELMQGFMTDPLVFGASNRFSSLVAAPGSYGRIDAIAEQSDWSQQALIGTANGLTAQPAPVSYFVSGDLSRADARKDGSTAQGGNATVGLGWKPSFDMGVFAFGTQTGIRATVRSPELPNNPLEQAEHRGDLGFNYKLAADNQIWIKVGSGSQRNDVSGPFVSQSTADALNTAFQTQQFAPNGQLDRFASSLAQEDIQLRHSFALGGGLLSWGVEHSGQRRVDALVTTFQPVQLGADEHLRMEANDAYLSLSRGSGAWTYQMGLLSQNTEVRRSSSNTVDIVQAAGHLVSDTTDERANYAALNPQFGLRWSPNESQTWRVVAQQWRRPASANQLGLVDTLGIPFNDRLTSAGGLFQRLRLQMDKTWGRRGMLQVFADKEVIDNGLGGKPTAIGGFEVTQLESLRNRPDVFAAPVELEETPLFVQGDVTSLGIAGNLAVSSSHTFAARYLYRDARQTGANTGLAIPLVPRDFVQLRGQWLLSGRWSLGSVATYRGVRYRDDLNTQSLAAGWSLGVSAYWESANKRTSVQGVVDNVLSNDKAGLQPDAHYLVRVSQRF